MARNASAQYGARGVMICSLTNTAASEIGSRDTGVDPEMVGTLHSMCYRAIGKPPVLSRKDVDAWNAAHPQYRLSGVGDGSSAVDPSEAAKCRGDDLYRQANVYRSQLREDRLWPESVRRFADTFREFRRSREVVDFVDMIERARDGRLRRDVALKRPRLAVRPLRRRGAGHQSARARGHRLVDRVSPRDDPPRRH